MALFDSFISSSVMHFIVSGMLIHFVYKIINYQFHDHELLLDNTLNQIQSGFNKCSTAARCGRC